MNPLAEAMAEFARALRAVHDVEVALERDPTEELVWAELEAGLLLRVAELTLAAQYDATVFLAEQQVAS